MTAFSLYWQHGGQICPFMNFHFPRYFISFLQTSTLDPYRHMGAYFVKNLDRLGMEGNKEGIERVLRDVNYAHILESPAADFEVNRNCNLVTIGDHFKIGYYAFAFQNGEG